MSGALPSAANIKGVTPWRSQRSRNDGCWGLAEHKYIYICIHNTKQQKIYMNHMYSTCSHKHLDSTPSCCSWHSLDIYIFNNFFGRGILPHFLPPKKKLTIFLFVFQAPKVLLPLITSSLKLKGSQMASLPTVSSNFWALGSAFEHQTFQLPHMDTAYVREKPPPNK